MLPIIQIGPLALRTSGLLLLIGAYVGLSLAERRLPKDSLTPNQLYTLVFLGFIAAVLGGRLVYIGGHFSFFRSSPLDVVSLDASLLDPFGAIVFCLAAILIYTQRKGIPFWKALDGLTPALAVVSVFLGLAHLASGQAYGMPTHLPWGVELWGRTRHPTQVYETLAAAVILGILWKKDATPFKPGLFFLRFMILSASATLLIDAWRVESASLFLGFRLTQVVAWFFLAIGLFLSDRLQVIAIRKSG